MKNLLTSVSLVLATVPFAFWKMDGPFVQGLNSNKEGYIGITPVYFLNKKTLTPSPNSFNYLFIYNEQNGYALGCASFKHIDLIKSVNFFQGNCEECFVDKNPLRFFLVKESPNLLLKNLEKKHIEMIGGIKLVDFFYIFCSLYLKDSSDLDLLSKLEGLNLKGIIHQLQVLNKIEEIGSAFGIESLGDNEVIRLSKDFSISSSISISNEENGIKIKYDHKSLDLQPTLANYFSNSHKNAELDLLNKSHILNVFAVMKGENNVNSIIWGLAKDNKTGENFHWITDLEADISVLIDQYK